MGWLNQIDMLQLLRVGLIITCAFLFWGAWYVAPGLLSSQSLYYFLGIWVPTWALALHFYRKLSELSTLKEMKARPNHRLNLVLPEIRGRVWWLASVGAISSLILWTLASTDMAKESAYYGLAAGFLVGIELSYLVLLPFWFNEIHHFIERVKLDDNVAQRREGLLKELGASSSKK